MAAYVKQFPFVENMPEKVFNLGSDTLKVALSNTSFAQSIGTLAGITEITYTNCSARTITVSASSQTSGTYSLVCTDLVLTASGGTVGPFRYVAIYDDTATNDEVVCSFDYGSSITLNDTETFTLDFSSSLFTLA
jgi:hypothetical protein